MTIKLSPTQIAALQAKVEGKPLAMVNFARTFLVARGMYKQARELCRRAVDLSPDDREIAIIAQMIFSIGPPNYYFTMVQDADRHALYERAFAQMVKPGSLVIDIGAGTGLFAMMAARAGAGKVIAFEGNDVVAEATREVIKANGLSGQVEIINKMSHEAEVGIDLPERGDLLIWDNLANNLIGAGGLNTVRDARHRLLKPAAPIIPYRAEICAAFAQNIMDSDREMRVVEGFDMSPFNAIRVPSRTANPEDFEHRSDPVVLRDVDFTTDELETGRICIRPENAKGEADCIVQWIRFHLAPDIVYDTSTESVFAFGQKMHHLDKRQLESDGRKAICSNIDGEALWIWDDA